MFDVFKQIKQEIGDQDSEASISSAVFENVMKNNTIKADVIKELHEQQQIRKAAELQQRIIDENLTTYSGTTFVQ